MYDLINAIKTLKFMHVTLSLCMYTVSSIATLLTGRPMCQSISAKTRTETSPSNTRSRLRTESQRPADSREREVRMYMYVCMYVCPVRMYVFVCMYVCR